jgi:polysaccharide pyruvyl transferase CsaB
MKILIFGNFGNGNNGDEVVLMAMLQEFRQLDPNVQITVISGNPVLTERLHGVRAIRRRFSPEVIQAIARTDVVIIGGGGILIDQAHSNLKYSLVILVAYIFQKPTMVYGIGLDTLTGSIARKSIKFSFNKVDVIALRDKESKEGMRKLGVRTPIYVTADPAFTLDTPHREDFREVLNRAGIYEKSSPLIGISVWPTDNINSYQRVLQIFADLADHLIVKYGCRIAFLVMSTIGFEGDLEGSYRIVEMMKHRDGAQVLGVDYHPRALMATFGQMDLIIGMRYHSLILSTLMHVPLIGIERKKYPKNIYFLREVQQTSGGSAHSVTADQLKEHVAKVWGKKAEMKSLIIKGDSVLRKRASRNIELFKELVVASQRANRLAHHPLEEPWSDLRSFS